MGSYEVSTSASASSNIDSSIENQGNWVISGTGKLIIAGSTSFKQTTNSSYVIVNSVLEASSNVFTIANGTLKGSGNITASVYISGQLNVGNSPGRAFINGNLYCDKYSILQIEIA